MTLLFGIAVLIAAIGLAISSVLLGVSTIIWARRCDPRNRSFVAPPLPRSEALVIAGLRRFVRPGEG